MRDMTDYKKFVSTFASFRKLLIDENCPLQEENVCRLFDIWLDNLKDERMIKIQERMARNETEGDDWKHSGD